jgi:hypothetical protein
MDALAHGAGAALPSCTLRLKNRLSAMRNEHPIEYACFAQPAVMRIARMTDLLDLY